MTFSDASMKKQRDAYAAAWLEAATANAELVKVRVKVCALRRQQPGAQPAHRLQLLEVSA